MTITNLNLASHELISLPVEISNSPDPTLRGRLGIVRDETRNTLLVETAGRLVRVPKAGSSFTFTLSEGNSAVMEGSRIRFRPEDRVRRGLARW